MSTRRPPLPRARTMVAAFLATAAVLVAAAAGPAASGAPPGAARDLAQVYFSNTLTRAEVISVVGGAVHDYRIDEGRVIAVRPNANQPSAIDLLERDGTKQTIAYSSSTQITEAGQPVDQTALTKGLFAITVRQGDGPAVEIRLFPQLLAAPR